ncbi:hypothetical protein ROZALSC1DRAFT_26803 [Rozella allomycis CSF55]|uniref:Transcription factor CBF/NF-Y/archaeal histone domain-containing protein n=1 Tax=Rozella allomycis (strain CSF55) TaxID=988480 RepID=A0A075ANI0_ROZAC|nr:hypothetical protein O9G_003152 [Rozella allomycis CSF55]RKP21807.1 hypothetical protein ROZALSC1DRAFT_26803 [Rozella allomycis CSF55]|eukprot:EPZ31430.1 hypothetical protein O9G_003152 [Rozella allomycis CSF55]
MLKEEFNSTIASKKGQKSLSAKHVLEALKSIEYPEFVDEIQSTLSLRKSGKGPTVTEPSQVDSLDQARTDQSI